MSSFSIGSFLKSPITLPAQIAESVAQSPATQMLRQVAASSVFTAGQAMSMGAMMTGAPFASPLIAMGSAALAQTIAGTPPGFVAPPIMQRANYGFGGAQQIGAQLPAYGQYAAAGMPNSFATAGFNNINAASYAATANAGFMPSGNNGLDLANAVANAPAYSPAEQALLNQIQDPQQRAMQQLQMFMQKQALLATMLSNLANMRHEMLKTVANNLRA
jgi:hypothetical protein